MVNQNLQYTFFLYSVCIIYNELQNIEVASFHDYIKNAVKLKLGHTGTVAVYKHLQTRRI